MQCLLLLALVAFARVLYAATMYTGNRDFGFPADNARTTKTENPAWLEIFGKPEDFGKTTEKPTPEVNQPPSLETKSDGKTSFLSPAGNAKTKIENPAWLEIFGKPENFGKTTEKPTPELNQPPSLEAKSDGKTSFLSPAGNAKTKIENPAWLQIFGKPEDFGKTTEKPSAELPGPPAGFRSADGNPPLSTESPGTTTTEDPNQLFFDVFANMTDTGATNGNPPLSTGSPGTTTTDDPNQPYYNVFANLPDIRETTGNPPLSTGSPGTTTTDSSALSTSSTGTTTTEDPNQHYYNVFANMTDSGKTTEMPKKFPDRSGDKNNFVHPVANARSTTTELPTTFSTASPIIQLTLDNGMTLGEGECILKDKMKGVCLPFLHCNHSGPISPLNDRSHNKCSRSLHVCCQSTYATELSSTISPIQIGDPNQRKACGIANHQGPLFRSSDSKLTVYGEFPWVLGILENEDKDPFSPWNRATYIGGATLIGPQAAITAAHVVFTKLRDEEPIKVRAGDFDTMKDNEIFPHVESAVEKGSVHEAFDSGSYSNNIALLFLETPISRAVNIGYACLPPPGQLPPNNGESCYIVGWTGFDSKAGSSDDHSFKKISTNIIASQTCEADLKAKEGYSKKFSVQNTMMCTKGGRREDCTGTRGSAFVCPIPNEDSRYTQYGIGLECGVNRPALHTNVINYRDWVDKEMKLAGLDTSTYSY